MIKESEILGIPVMNKQGSKVGLIKDVIYSKSRDNILGFSTSKVGLFKNSHIIKFTNVSSLGRDVIFIENEKSIYDINEFGEDKFIYKNVIEQEVIVENGESIGFVKDILIDRHRGKIIGFILTEGLIDDIRMGRNVLPIDRSMVFGENNIIISTSLKAYYDRYKQDYKKLLELL